MNEEKIKEVFSDEQFVKELLEMETVQEVQGALSKKGLELSEGQLNNIRDGLMKMSVNGDGELSDEQLDDVAGGILPVVVAIATSVIGGVASTAISESIKKWKW